MSASENAEHEKSRDAAEITTLKRRLTRERTARQAAENQAEEGLRALYQRQREAELMRAIATAANEAVSTEAAIRSCLERVCAHVGWPVGHALLVDNGELRSSGIWVTRAGQSFDKLVEVTLARSFAPGVGLPGTVLAERAPRWIVDVYADDNFP